MNYTKSWITTDITIDSSYANGALIIPRKVKVDVDPSGLALSVGYRF